MISLDGAGLYGALLASTLTSAFFGSALLIFLHLWRRGRLNMDEEAAEQMVTEEQKNGE